MSNYIRKLSKIKSDIGVNQDAIFFEQYTLDERNKHLGQVVLEMADDYKRIHDIVCEGFEYYDDRSERTIKLIQELREALTKIGGIG